MKKLIILLVVSAVIITAVALYSSGSLQTQLLNDQNQPATTSQVEENRTVDDCKKMSEKLASDCIQEIAIREKDTSLCLEITRRSDRARCQREVEFAQ